MKNSRTIWLLTLKGQAINIVKDHWTQSFSERHACTCTICANADSTAESGSYSTDTYSTTNIQVAGVDEADTVKTDGKYIYTITSTSYPYAYISSMPPDYGASAQNIIYIVKADPRDARVVAKITLDNNTYPAGIFLSEDSSRLVVLASQYQVYA